MSTTHSSRPTTCDHPPEQVGARQFHIVLHGLIGVRICQRERYVELHIPCVQMHMYRIGGFSDLQRLPQGRAYSLSGVRSNTSDLDVSELPRKSIFLSLSGNRLTFSPAGTYACIRLPWPNSIRGVRSLIEDIAPEPLFFLGQQPLAPDPLRLKYIQYLTYDLAPADRPAIASPDGVLWASDALDNHNRLHLYADPPVALLQRKMYVAHMTDAYSCFNNQLFDPPCSLEPNLTHSERMKFRNPERIPEIPVWEQVDLVNQKDALLVIGCSGNCLAPLIVD